MAPMRLLNVQSLKVETVHPVERKIPYAILSHVWGQGEVAFDDINEDCSQMAGYCKISNACRQAQQDGFEYIWIDSCCINKSSSAELSESINSMYTWYRESAVCYIFLCDVTRCEENLSTSRWFQRAWTLQEMIAPPKLKIFDRDWTLLGTSETHNRVLSVITGVDESAFGSPSYDLRDFSIAARMCWAANREATRKEDVAYSLMGLFDVNMPLLYGEGFEKAFRRLQEEILKVSPDQSILAWGFDPSEQYKEECISICKHKTSGDLACPLLASSPSDFVKCNNIVAGFTSDDKSISFTNMSLRLEMPILKIEPDTFVTDNCYAFAVLNCGFKDDGGIHPLGILLVYRRFDPKAHRYESRVDLPVMGPQYRRSSVFIFGETTAKAETFKIPINLLFDAQKEGVHITDLKQTWTNRLARNWCLRLRWAHSEYALLDLLPKDRWKKDALDWEYVSEPSADIDSQIVHADPDGLQFAAIVFQSVADRITIVGYLLCGVLSWDLVLYQYDGDLEDLLSSFTVLQGQRATRSQEEYSRLVSGENLQDVARVSVSQFLDKVLVTVDVQKFSRPSSEAGWQSQDGLFPYPSDEDWRRAGVTRQQSRVIFKDGTLWEVEIRR